MTVADLVTDSELLDLVEIEVREILTQHGFPGDTTTVSVELLNPIAMEVGQRFAIREGGKTVGAGVVLGIDK